MKKHISVCGLLAMCCTGSIAAAEVDLSGTVTFGGRLTDVSGSEAKFNEYRDVDDDVFGDISLLALWEEGYHIDFTTENAGFDDQSYILNGGRYGKLKYSLYYDEIPHFLTEDASTMYLGVGSDSLIDTSADPTPQVTLFDYNRDRKDYGGNLRYQFENNFFVKMDASKVETEGIVPFGGRPSATEFPAPVDWDETQVTVTGGYAEDKFSASLTGQFIDFDNSDDAITRTVGTSTEISSLPPDNEVSKVKAKILMRPDTWSSMILVTATYSRVTNDITLSDITPAETRDFDGEVTKGQLAASWNFVPIEDLDVRLSAKYDDRDNDSTEIVTSDGNENDPYDSDTVATGINLNYSLAHHTRLEANYDFRSSDYSGRSDSDGMDDHAISFQVRNQSIEDIELRARYGFLNRDGDYTGTSDTERSYDVADQDRHEIELEAGYYGIEDLGLIAEFTWSDSDFTDTDSGLTELEHYDFYLSTHYAITPAITTMVYGGIERDQSNDLGDAEEVTYYTYAFGANVEAKVLSNRLTLYAGWEYLKSDGKAKYDDPTLIDSSDAEDYHQNSVELKGTYVIDDSWSMTLGYLYEDFDLSDDQWTGYVLDPNGATLTGAYDDPDYDGHTVYVSAKYSF